MFSFQRHFSTELMASDGTCAINICLLISSRHRITATNRSSHVALENFGVSHEWQHVLSWRIPISQQRRYGRHCWHWTAQALGLRVLLLEFRSYGVPLGVEISCSPGDLERLGPRLRRLVHRCSTCGAESNIKRGSGTLSDSFLAADGLLLKLHSKRFDTPSSNAVGLQVAQRSHES